MKRHLFQFNDEDTAKADQIVGANWTPIVPGEGGGWGNMINPAVSVYSDQAVQSGWWCIVTSDDVNTALAQHTECRLAWDNDSAVILGGTWTGNEMSAVYVTPVPAGSYNPWNGQPPAPPEEQAQ